MLSNPEVYPQMLQMPYGSPDSGGARLAGERGARGKPDLLLVAVAGDGDVVGGAAPGPDGTDTPRRRRTR